MGVALNRTPSTGQYTLTWRPGAMHTRLQVVMLLHNSVVAAVVVVVAGMGEHDDDGVALEPVDKQRNGIVCMNAYIFQFY